VILLPGQEDQAIWDYFVSVGFPAEQQVRSALRALTAEGAPMSTAALEARVELSRSRLETMLKVLDVDGAAKRVRGGWIATGAEWEYDAGRYRDVARVRQDEQRAMREYQSTASCRMRLLREQLDDPEAVDCGRCDNCGGLTLAADIGEETVCAAASVLGRPGVAFDPRRMWPTAMLGLGIEVRGKVAASDQAEAGRVIARLTDLGFGSRLRSLFAAEAADAPVPEDLVKASVQVLASWDWAQRPRAVVHVGSVRRPRLIADLASRVAELGRLSDLGSIPHVRPSSTGRTNSAMRLREVWNGYEMSTALTAQLTGQPVLLVDDFVDTGWTFTVLARLLRRAGAGEVYPFALALAA
jgi:ATP-dependent DNA helicase RecQ